MAFISWRSEYEIGVRQVDAEHRKLFDLVNEYYDQHMHGASRKEIERILNGLVAYAEEHFQNEEAIMEEYGYPKIEDHRKQHADLFTSIFAITERLLNEPAKADRETLSFLKKWLRDHIVQDDVDIGHFLRLKQLQAMRDAEKGLVNAADKANAEGEGSSKEFRGEKDSGS
jgi:hemerythrin-like metal-binding protein